MGEADNKQVIIMKCNGCREKKKCRWENISWTYKYHVYMTQHKAQNSLSKKWKSTTKSQEKLKISQIPPIIDSQTIWS